MNAPITLTQRELPEFLFHVAPVRPVFVIGPPGVGKTALVNQFARDFVGLDCVTFLGTQLAPEDIIGIPELRDGTSRFCPPSLLVRDTPFVLFLDELNAASLQVQKAFYTLITEQRLGEYVLPTGSVIIGAGNRTQDQAQIKPMPSALVNRMVFVHLRVSHRDWLEWAAGAEIHPWVYEYIQTRPSDLFVAPPKTEEPFSTPRSWHMLSDALQRYGEAVPLEIVQALAYGCLTSRHATQFVAFVKQVRGKYRLAAILKGDLRWPGAPEDRDILYFLASSLKSQLAKELPPERDRLSGSTQDLAFRAKALIKDLAAISLEIAQMVVARDEETGEALPNWFLVEVMRDIPRLVQRDG